MVEVRFDKNFAKTFSKIKNDLLREKIINQIKKISEYPEIGKPMQHNRKETRELYAKPFRLSYAYLRDKSVVYVLDLYHKSDQ
ncbi:hypothetical protein CMI42_00160 [Candidatus Pacearchaeota archaeon]|jgi:mRNA-degrading endonuclease RelE of RelBE toxin-antitoxin system|nr:hypothetical protein [Candidatus Pacearchaeota archaeon]|tara:strand:- start:1023 stop:1271 length:249 start_codon:yes stop_codon:yes gene_type:complete